MPPLVILRGAKGKRWTTVDRTLAVALTLSQDLICSGCGQPKHEAWNPDSEGYYEAKDAECQGCAELARDSKKHEDHDPARKVWTINTRTAEDPPLRPWKPE